MFERDRIEILEKLEAFKKSDPDFKVFGSNKHKYLLNPVATEDEISALEKKYEIQLPEEYRWFLLNLGNGGAGPNYGIMTLQESIREVTSWLEEDEDNEIPPEKYLGAKFDPPKTIERSRRMDYFPAGMIPISDAGCCMYYHLCLDGSERDNIWFWSNDNAWRPVPAPEDRPNIPKGVEYHKRGKYFDIWYNHLLSEENKWRFNFLDWYKSWLDKPIIIE